MKTTIFKKTYFSLLLTIAVLALLGAGCVEENLTGDVTDQLWELSADGNEAIIENNIDDIEFKFCLLDEQGKPSTIFNEGENFTLYFSVTNKTEEKLYFYPGYAFSEKNNFCEVYNSSTQISEGKPFIFNGVDMIGTGGYPIDKGEKYIFEQPWKVKADSTWQWKHGNYESAGRELLPSGSYFTGFEYRFEFVRPDDKPSIYTDTIKFKINFKIQ